MEPNKPITRYECEFGFLNGHTQFFTVIEGRDIYAADTDRIRLELHHEDSVEEVIVHRASLAYMRTTKRVVQPEPQVTEGLKLVGVDG